jgi:hypothetical protein
MATKDPLEQALSRITPEDMQPRPLDQGMFIRVSADEKASIEQVAASLGLSVSAYLRRLHEIAEVRLRPASQARRPTKSR